MLLNQMLIKMKKTTILILNFLLFASAFEIFSRPIQTENEIIAIHPKIGAIYNIYQADFRNFQNGVDCGIFNTGSGFRATGSLNLEKYLNTKLALGLGLGFSDRGGELIIGNSFPSRDLNTNEVVTVNTDNILDVSLSTIDINPNIRYNLTDDLFGGPLRFVGGFNLGFVLSPSFQQYEEIVSPSNAVFINSGNTRTQRRDIASGEIVTANSLIYGLNIGIENLVPVSDNAFLSQQLSFEYFLNDIASDVTWKTYAVKFEVGFRIGVHKPEPEPVIIPELEPEPEPEPIIVYDPEVKIDLLDQDYSIKTGSELLASSPIVNAVFFDKNRAEIPVDYVTEDKNIDYFKSNAVNAHKYILPRIAQIVKSNPSSMIVLKGATSGIINEPSGLELAKNRSEAIKNALISLGIDDARINTEYSLLPEKPSNQEFLQGTLENQRVDIVVLNAPLQEYVDFQEYANIEGQYKLKIDTTHTNNTQVNVKSNISNDIQYLNNDIYQIKVNQRLENFEEINVENSVLVGSINKNENFEIKPVDYKTIEEVLKLDNFAAILRFDYDSSILSEDNKLLLKQLSEKLPAGSTIVILGSADGLGSNVRNQELTNERASNTEVFIKEISGDKFVIETGVNNDKFPEDTPQGRFLNRSIKIIVKKAGN